MPTERATSLTLFVTNPDPTLAAVDAWIAGTHRSVLREGQDLARLGGVTAQVVADDDLVAMFNSVRARLGVRRGKLHGNCNCRSGGSGAKCAHACALVYAVRNTFVCQPDAPVSRWLRRKLAPPMPEETIRELGLILKAPRGPERRALAGREVAWMVRMIGGTAIFELNVREARKDGSLGRPKHPRKSDIAEILAQSPHAQDRAIAAMLESAVPARESSYGYYSERATPADVLRKLSAATLLAELVGHPAVYLDELETRLDVVVGEPALRVREDGDSWVVEASLTGTFAGIGGNPVLLRAPGRVVAIQREQGRATVARVDDAIREVLEAVAERAVRVPLAYGVMLADSLDASNPGVALVLPPGLCGREVTGNPGLRVVFEAPPPDAEVTLRIRPIDGGDYFSPGDGPSLVRGSAGGERVSARRDLETERHEASRVAGLLGLGAAAMGPGESLNLDRVFEVLEALDGPALAGVAVDWPTGQKISVAASPKVSHKVQVTNAQDWFGVGGTVEVDGETIALAKLIAARREKRRFVELAPGKFVRLARLLRPQEERLLDVTYEERGQLVLSRAVAARADEIFAGTDVVVPTSWSKVVERARRARNVDVTPPKALTAKLRDYQREGYAWMRRLSELGLGGVLADDMGLGKTVQAIGILVARAAEGAQLVVCPASVTFNWQRELARFSPSLKPIELRTADRVKVLGNAGPGDVVITSYGLVRSTLELLGAVEWTTLAIDEAQMIKNWETDTARAVRRLRATFRVALTGTPMENHLGELYSILQTVAPGTLGSWERFAKEYAIPIERHGDKDCARQLAALVKPLLLRRTKKQVLTELPDRTEVRVDIVLPKAERALYEAARQSALEKLAGLSNEPGDGRIQVLAELTRLRQLACAPHLVVPSAPRVSEKIRRLLEELDEILEEGHSALVFSQFVRQLELVSEALTARGVGHLMLTGSTPQDERRRLVDAFQAGEKRVFLISLKAGGTGLNLTAADYVFIVDPWWNPAVEDQAADRAHRIGQTRPVTIVRLVAKDTIEEQVVALHERKRALVAGILGEADVAARLSTSELVDLLRSGAAATDPDEDDAPGPRARPPQAVPASSPTAAMSSSKPAARLAAGVPHTFDQALADYRADSSQLAGSTLLVYVRALRTAIGEVDRRGSFGEQLERRVESLSAARSAYALSTRRVQSSALIGLIDSLEKRGWLEPHASARLLALVREYRA